MPETGRTVNIAGVQIDNDEKIPIIRRFVSFIEASTAELEEMNMKLALSSVTDGLTRLYIYGHKEGDHVIQALSDVLRTTTTGVHSCFLGRWGGEEFMVLLSDSSADDAAVLAERIRLAFASVSYETAGCQTVSIGVTQARDENADALYNRVDKALYMAKAAGKNQVVRLD